MKLLMKYIIDKQKKKLHEGALEKIGKTQAEFDGLEHNDPAKGLSIVKLHLILINNLNN